MSSNNRIGFEILRTESTQVTQERAASVAFPNCISVRRGQVDYSLVRDSNCSLQCVWLAGYAHCLQNLPPLPFTEGNLVNAQHQNNITPNLE